MFTPGRLTKFVDRDWESNQETLACTESVPGGARPFEEIKFNCVYIKNLRLDTSMLRVCNFDGMDRFRANNMLGFLVRDFRCDIDDVIFIILGQISISTTRTTFR